MQDNAFPLISKVENGFQFVAVAAVQLVEPVRWYASGALMRATGKAHDRLADDEYDQAWYYVVRHGDRTCTDGPTPRRSTN